jgi:fumarylacetoacetase
LDLNSAAEAGLLPESVGALVAEPALNGLFAVDPDERRALRLRLSDLLSDPAHATAVTPHLHSAGEAVMHLPARIGDYTDFYVGLHHATNIGRQFRPENPLLPNYKYVPIGYHGRASSIRPSGTSVTRPNGQRKQPDVDTPSFGPSRRLDFELEMGVWVGSGNALGRPIAIADAPRHFAGMSLLNDWSARDIQAWEYQPLGPFLAKNFLTTISPWVVTAEALAPFRIAQPSRPDGDPAPLPYLLDDRDQTSGSFAIRLEVFLSSAQMRAQGFMPYRISHSEMRYMYWTVAQMIAHHSSNGCNLMPGDLLGTGTISSPEPDGYGSLMEITNGGKEPITLPTGETRNFLEDGDAIILGGTADAEGYRSIGFGNCAGTVDPAP